MTQIVRIRSTWGGAGVIGPGLTTFYTATSGVGLPAAVKAFFTALQSSIPDDVTITVPNGGDLIEDTTGGLAGTWSEPSGGGVVTGTNSGLYSLGVGVRIKWFTGGLRFGRRVVGSTFVCPVGGTAFDNLGRPTTAFQTVVQNAANGLLAAAPTLRILSPEKLPGDGMSSQILSASVPLQVSWLRSRRT